MTSRAKTPVPTQIYKIYIRASAQAIWDAITSPEWSARWGYQAPANYELRPGGRYRGLANAEMRKMGMPEVMIEGEVLEIAPPHRLVQTWHPLWSPEISAEEPSRITWEIAEDDGGVSTLTLTHELDGAPLLAQQVKGSGRITQGGGGWSWTLSDLKTLLETGKAMAG
jgi:uncharacterized protein YndB with AHSA1/START domain